ncbi:MAG TPA: hypothetical protein VJ111_03450, partial [Chitinophagaceae bacterium]|nr:hypothetical protein [Chitinophagaceae bacterium]
ALNTWTFSDGTKNHVGVFSVNPVLHTTIQSNNTYMFEMTGIHKGSGQLLTMAISLSDLDFNTKSYQSGIGGSNHSTSFYYSGSAGSRDAIYSSSNNDPGAVMTYNISYYDVAKNTVTITFSGQVFDASGNLVKISKGKMTAHIDRK